jgi:hypothetical protein
VRGLHLFSDQLLLGVPAMDAQTALACIFTCARLPCPAFARIHESRHSGSVEYCWCSVDMRTYSAACAGLGPSGGGSTDGEFGLSIVGTSGNVLGQAGTMRILRFTSDPIREEIVGGRCWRGDPSALRPFQAMFCCTPFLRPMPKGCSLHLSGSVFAQRACCGQEAIGGFRRAVSFAPSCPVLLHVRVIPPPLSPAVPTGLLVF